MPRLASLFREAVCGIGAATAGQRRKKTRVKPRNCNASFDSHEDLRTNRSQNREYEGLPYFATVSHTATLHKRNESLHADLWTVLDLRWDPDHELPGDFAAGPLVVAIRDTKWDPDRECPDNSGRAPVIVAMRDIKWDPDREPALFWRCIKQMGSGPRAPRRFGLFRV